MVYNNAKVYGDAQIYGEAVISGDTIVTKKVITFGNAFCYDITVTDKHIQIGCQQHLKSKWENFTDKEIIEMDGEKALNFWRLFKPLAINMVLFD